MQAAGQLEVITSPYTHPKLPLLADTNSARVASPEVSLPQQRFQWAEDIPRHLRKAWEMYQQRFGTTPRGLWPSEQSVSPEILPDIAKQGFQCICSDEAVLGESLNRICYRDEVGNLREPELLYRPYRLEIPQGELAIVFRDHRLSDLIGFTYSSMEPQQAASDLVGHLEAISRSFQQQASGTALDHLNFYLRLDFKAGIQVGESLPKELHLLWFYPGKTHHNSPAPLASLPDKAPLNYLFHHHLGIHLLTGSMWLEEAGEDFRWYSHTTRAQVGLNQCLELALPWADLHVEPDSSLRLVVVLADDGDFRSYLPEEKLVALQVP